MNEDGPVSRRSASARQGERGMALVIAMLVMTVLALVAMHLGASTVNDRRMASDDITASKALHYAEAGVYEAIARIQKDSGPDPTDANAARKVVQVLLSNSGGTAGADTTLLATGQPAGQWLPYSTATRGADALTIEFRTDAARTTIYRYDKTGFPPIQDVEGAPIYRITSTSVVGSSRRTIVAEVIWNPLDPELKAAFTAADDVKFTGNAIACGYNHRADTPINAGSSGRSGNNGCNEYPSAVPPEWEYPGNAVAGIWSTGDANASSSNSFGVPNSSSNNAGFYAGPWEVLGMTKNQFFALAGTARDKMPSNATGFTYLDNDAIKQNTSGNFGLKDGTGFLYVDGDLTLHDNWRGIIYVEGNVKFNGNSWVLGALIVKGSGKISFNGGATMLYSKEAIDKYVVALASGRKPMILSWRES